ncbi:lipoprotein-releasing ABC transporter permease subunit [Yunchengibacter salinarum]|uniref:lipoprotein-releasing ABC transporter permease subunit n=1 Tax=Yunchengibacter salinarum TaxID=3133399 RepID=UPI0035B614DE
MIARGYEWTIVRRYLSARRRDRFISVTAILSILAIALGVAALIVVMSVMNGFRSELMDRILGYHGHVLVQGYGGQISDYDALAGRIRDVDGVVRVTPFVEQQVMVTRDDQAWGGIVRGLPDDSFTDPDALNLADIRAGALEDAVADGGIVIGYELAANLGVGVGDEVTIVSPKPVNTPFGSTLRYLAFPVRAVVEVGVYQFDESFIGMPLSQAQTFFRTGSAVTNMEVFLTSPEAVDAVRPAISEVVGRDAYVRGWKSFNQALVGALQTERVAMFIVLTLIIVVAVFNIASSLFMLVKDKAADIAILRTMGTSRAGIMRIFVTTGLAVGLMGIAAGGLLSWAFIANLQTIKAGIEGMLGLNLWDPSVRFITNMRAEVNWTEVLLTVVVAAFLSFIATLIPARRAASLDPVSVLRYE